MKGVIIMRHIKVQNANAIAGLTWGFPAIANFLGFTHGLQRQFGAKSDKPALSLLGAGIICHEHDVQAHKTHEFGEHLFALTRNPLTKKEQSPAFVEEGRMHLDVSLVIPFDGYVKGGDEGAKEVAKELKQLALMQRLAGGTIIDIGHVAIKMLTGSAEQNSIVTRRIMRSLLPGFALVSRQQTLAQHQQIRAEQPGPLADYDCADTAIQAWLEFAAMAATAQVDENDPTKADWPWNMEHPGGWLKPIAVGYKGISPLYPAGEVANVRDPETPLQLVETLYSLGEWLSPHRIKTIEQLYWYYQHDEQNGIYQCKNNAKTIRTTDHGYN